MTTEDEFPRPEPDYNAKSARDFSPFEEALAAFTPEHAAEMEKTRSSHSSLPRFERHHDT